MKILVTGASGFVGKALCAELLRRGYVVRAALRSAQSHDAAMETFIVGAIDGKTDWSDALCGIDAVVHLAARVHVMRDDAVDALAAYRDVNVDGTLNLAGQATQARVRRFIFISSIKVNGESTLSGQPFTAEDAPAPVDAYGMSKREAEDGLRLLADATGMEMVIIRPPLVYGPGVKANFHSMMRWLDKGWPLPLAAIDNRRTLVALDNLVDLIITCIRHPAAANQTFLAGDGEDLSTTGLLQRMAAALGKKACLMPVPMRMLIIAARLFGKQAMAQRLCASLQVDSDKARNLLGWTPPVSVDDALRETARYYREFRQ